ncbi:TrmB family transcriptional regulator [Scopulibacillus cellulosilyticus]|uniref:TrmB family transcriptional regulator n=1 Tax=Scopulibacillus cellulosilyticus TaxID=2665665 RepID=A0ABW2PZG8_9BACL
MDLIKILQTFGLTQYEAKAFASLVSSGTSTGYQISKLSGIPRGRIYDILQSLVDKGLVMTEEGKDGTKTYCALPVDAFLDQQKQKWETSYQNAKSKLKAIEKQQPERENYISTVKGTEGILSFCRSLIQSATKQILLSMWDPMYTELLPSLQESARQNCSIRGIVFDVEKPLKGLHSHRKNDYMNSLSNNKWFILSVDSRELLYGHAAEKNEKAFYTNDLVHLFLLEDYIWHDVLVNRLVEKGDQQMLDSWILPEMEHFFGQKMLPDEFWLKKSKYSKELVE